MGMIKNNVRPFFQSTTEYWRIRTFTEISKNRINVILDCYLSKNDFIDQKPIVESYQFDINLSELQAISLNFRESLYDYIQNNLSYFDGVIRDIGD